MEDNEENMDFYEFVQTLDKLVQDFGEAPAPYSGVYKRTFEEWLMLFGVYLYEEKGIELN